MRYVPVKASEDRARQFQTGELSDFAPSRAVRRCLVVVPKSKIMHNERKRAGAPATAAPRSVVVRIFFSRGTRIP
jgi:hypothetical protein